MSRKKLVLVIIIMAIILLNVNFIIHSNKNIITEVSEENKELEPYFNSEEINYILTEKITFDNIKPYLKYQGFSIYNFHIYEQLRIHNSFSHLEAINYFNYPEYYSNNNFLNEALFLNNDLVLVNKKFYLKEDYQPSDLTDIITKNLSYIKRDNEQTLIVKKVLDQYYLLYQDAASEGFEFHIFSAYRDYEKQRILYYLINEEDNRISAKPGHSEHQTGMALDISTLKWGLSTYFENSVEYKWLIHNAHKYGFILRYPKNKEHLTGYSFEPWHFRYVGVEHAQVIYEMDLSLEEYLFKSYELK